MEGRRRERAGGVFGRPVPAVAARTRRPLVHRGAIIATLKKADVERLLSDYDADPIGALCHALRIVFDLPDGDWIGLLAMAPIDDERRLALMHGDPARLDELAAELNEHRTLGS
jgi:hypothetical protein